MVPLREQAFSVQAQQGLPPISATKWRTIPAAYGLVDGHIPEARRQSGLIDSMIVSLCGEELGQLWLSRIGSASSIDAKIMKSWII